MSQQTDHEDEIADAQLELLVRIENIDEECRLHANAHSRIALKAARAASIAAKFKLDLKESEGDWATEIRERLNEDSLGEGPKNSKTGRHRVTDLQVKAELSSHTKSRKANRDILDAETIARDWEAIRESSKDRGFQLKNITDLVIAEITGPRQAKPSRRAT